MPIRPLLQNGHFTPEDIKVLTAVFEQAIHDPAVILVAKRTIELARQGGRDPALLRDAVLKSLRDDPGVSGL